MATMGELLLMVAETQMVSYFESALRAMRENNSEDLKQIIKEKGVAKLELSLCEAYIQVMQKRHAKLKEEVRRHQRPTSTRGRAQQRSRW